MPAATPSPLGEALARAITDVRTSLGDPLAPVTVLVPAGPNGTLARRALATQGPILRVWFETPEGLLRDQLPASSWKTLRPEPAGWFRVTLARIVRDLHAQGALGRFGASLVRPAFTGPLGAALSRLEASGVSAAHLDAITTPAHTAERARLLATLLRAVEDARTKDALASPQALAQAATDAIGKEPGVGAALATGAVLVGDRELSFTTFTFLKAWLEKRTVKHVRAPASRNLPPAPSGMRAACADAEGVDVSTASLPADVRALSDGLFRADATAAGVGAAVTFAKTPDDVRECTEAVREVQRAIAAGTPLDRIAVVLPDAAPRMALEDAFDRAGIPVTWLIGFPARDLSAARVLRLAVDTALGADTPRDLYELLTHPALDLRARLGPDAIKGRGRWRRMLSDVVRARGLERIAHGVGNQAPREGLTGDDLTRENDARASLVHCTTQLKDALALLRLDTVGNAPLGAHARAWREFLYTWVRRSEARGRLLAMVEPLASSNAGPALSAREARDELEELLERELAQGNLAERSVRVLAPMHLLGGEVDVVLLLGLVHGRFPSVVREDPVLPDELLTLLSNRLGRALPLASEREALDRRRFAAAVGAARARVWLSIPGVSFAEDRPALPSPLALDALSAVLGRRALFSDLQGGAHACVVTSGTRARTWPLSADDAVGPLEHLVARLSAADGGIDAPLRALASHTTSRALLQLHRSMERAHTGALDAWTGLIPADLLKVPGLDGQETALRVLVDLVQDPGSFFFKHLLRAQKPPRLVPWAAPLERPTLDALLLDAAQDATIPSGDVADALHTLVLAELEEQKALGAFSDASLTQAQPMLKAIARAVADKIEDYARKHAPEGALTLADGLPWRVTDVAGRVVNVEGTPMLVELTRKVKRVNLKKEDAPALVLTALGLSRAGQPVDEVRLLPMKGSEGRGSVTALGPETVTRLAQVTQGAREGRYPIGDAKAFMLRAERPRVGKDPEVDPEKEAAAREEAGGDA